MREIKFRAWTGIEMITPPNDTIGCGSGAEIIEISLAGFVSKRNAYGLDVFGGKNPSFDEPEKDILLMQFTGLKDKNGKDIYEGDILGFGTKYKPAVSFENGSFTICGEPLGFNYDEHGRLETYDFKFCEIIGNIHENPELLNK